MMITIENIQDGTYLEGHELEYFVDDDTLIGEVYLDGNLIYQGLDVVSEDQLKLNFKKDNVIEESVFEAGDLSS
jgi:hypothetical protein|tara:strand:+ start:163 stop:384 length:222 start_codon:yes stop_codon:yes gene_type:complete